MVRRRQRLSWFQKNKKYIYIGGGALVLGITSFFVTLSMLDNKPNEEKISDNPIIINDYAYKTDESSIRINPDSLKKAEVETEEVQIEIIEENKKIDNVKKENPKVVEVSAVPLKKELTFIKPLDGEIILEYAKDKLVYSTTLEEWITHNGIDIKGEEAVPVKASADGKIKDKKVDPRYGNTIIIEHEDGYKTIYSNLSTLDLIEINQEIKQGDIISGVGAGYGFEMSDGSHIHFEIQRDGENINPLEKVK